MNEKRGTKLIAKNSRASFDYFLSQFLEVGLELTGTEIKSLRNHGASLVDSRVIMRNNEMYVLNMNIPIYDKGNIFNHDPKRTRKLLMHRQEINKYIRAMQEKGFTIVPTKIYFSKGRAKLEIALAKGKKLFDKRETIKRREDEIKIAKAIKGQKDVD
ncbi:MAG TPA: SsrA-binding protein [Firmicutes bacterium]|jgi:SsrA-binding protein|nr:SsrA-binding protein [Bacillota bacterium]